MASATAVSPAGTADPVRAVAPVGPVPHPGGGHRHRAAGHARLRTGRGGHRDPVPPARGSHRRALRVGGCRPVDRGGGVGAALGGQPRAPGVPRKHITIPGLRWRQIGFEPAGDPGLAPSPIRWMSWETVLVLVPTPGHTAGSMSLLIRRRERSQCSWSATSPMDPSCSLGGQVPGVGVRSQLVETTRRVLALKETMPDLVSCRRTVRPPPSGCWRAEAGGNQ
jgi:hypothetical protein